MPSDTAFLGSYERSADQASASIDRYAEEDEWSIGIKGFSPRLLSSNLMALEGLGIHIDRQNEIVKALRIMVMTNYSFLMLQSGWRSLFAAHAARELGIATAETATLAFFQQWELIAEAFIAAAMVTAALGAGMVGEKIGTGEWKLPHVNIKSPTQRRRAEEAIAGTNAFQENWEAAQNG